MPLSSQIKKAAGPCAAAAFAVLLALHLLLSGCSSYRAEPSFEAAEMSLSEGRYQEAIEGYNRVISDFPGSSAAAKSQYRIASIYNRHLKDREKAMEAYSALRYMYPASPEARLATADMAGIYSREGDHKKAVEEFQTLLDGTPAERLKYRRLIAAEYMKMNDLRQALIEYDELAASEDLPPELMPRILFQIASTYYIGGQAEEAARRFDDIIRRYPEADVAIEARLGKGNALAEAGHLPEAIEVLKGLEGEYPNGQALRTRIEWLEKRLREGPQEESGR